MSIALPEPLTKVARTRFTPSTLARLDALAERTRLSRAAVIRTLTQEGLDLLESELLRRGGSGPRDHTHEMAEAIDEPPE